MKVITHEELDEILERVGVERFNGCPITNFKGVSEEVSKIYPGNKSSYNVDLRDVLRILTQLDIQLVNRRLEPVARPEEKEAPGWEKPE